MRSPVKKGIALALSILLPFTAACAVFLAVLFRLSLPNEAGQTLLRGLAGEVRVVRDPWGIPHIFAGNEHDLFFAAGFVQAGDRLWQMDMMRRACSGRLAEVIGAAGLEWDRIARTLEFGESVQRERANLSPEMERLLTSFAAGVNAWMAGRRPAHWPPEFVVMAYRPEQWTVEDSLSVKPLASLGLGADLPDEILRTKILLKLSPEKAAGLLQPGIPMPENLALLKRAAPDFTEFFAHGVSNNWVVSGSRTQSGKPLLANDPHLGITLPPLWYEMHLECPTLRVTGATFPGLPLVIIGHNATAAWGITSSFADTEDIYIEEFDAAGERYRNADGWKPLEKTKETIHVRWRRTPATIELIRTERGPVISPVVIKSRLPISLKWTALEGGRTVEGFYRLNKAGNWTEFKAAMELIDSPPQNFVFADAHGDIGYYLNGRIPIRKKEAALFPYPGWKADGWWTGTLAEDEKPTILNPKQGFIVTANNSMVPAGYDHYISESWLLPFRAERIAELLSQSSKHTVETMMAVQNDIVSKQARLLLPYVLGAGTASGAAGEARRLLESWDGTIGAGAAPALFESFMDALMKAVFKDEMGDIFKGLGTLLFEEPILLYRILADRNSPWFDDRTTPAVENRDDRITKILGEAYAGLARRYGGPSKWDWAVIHSLSFRHALGRVPLLGFFNAGTHPMPGDAFTVRAAYPSPSGRTNAAASFRIIVDLGDLRKSVSINTSGESGHFLSRHYRDQLPLWLKGAYHPMLFERRDVEAQAQEVLLLSPVSK